LESPTLKKIKRKGLSGGAIAGIVIGTLAGTAMLVGAGYQLMCYGKVMFIFSRDFAWGTGTISLPHIHAFEDATV
jgi:hypothetical protein